MMIIDPEEVSRSGIPIIAEVPHLFVTGLGVLIAARTPRPTEMVYESQDVGYAFIK